MSMTFGPQPGGTPRGDLVANDAFSLAHSNIVHLPGPESAMRLFEDGVARLDDAAADSASRHDAFVQCLTGVELTADPTLTLAKSINAIVHARDDSQLFIERALSLHSEAPNVAEETKLFEEAIRTQVGALGRVFHARSAIAAAVAEVARGLGYTAEGIIVNPESPDLDPVRLRLTKDEQSFVMSVGAKGAALFRESESASHLIPLEPREWLIRTILEHRAAHQDQPDKQVALLRFELMLSPDSMDLKRQLANQLRQIGREDLAIEVTRDANAGRRSLD